MIRGALTLAIVPLAAACVMIATPGEAPTSATPLALVGGRVQPDPQSAALEDGVVLIDGGVVTAIGSRSRLSVPAGARLLDCGGTTVGTIPASPDSIWPSCAVTASFCRVRSSTSRRAACVVRSASVRASVTLAPR